MRPSHGTCALHCLFATITKRRDHDVDFLSCSDEDHESRSQNETEIVSDVVETQTREAHNAAAATTAATDPVQMVQT